MPTQTCRSLGYCKAVAENPSDQGPILKKHYNCMLETKGLIRLWSLNRVKESEDG